MRANSTVIASRLFRSQRYMVLLIVTVFVALLIITSISAHDYVNMSAIPDKVSSVYGSVKDAATGNGGTGSFLDVFSGVSADNSDDEDGEKADAPSEDDYENQENEKVEDDAQVGSAGKQESKEDSGKEKTGSAKASDKVSEEKEESEDAKDSKPQKDTSKSEKYPSKGEKMGTNVKDGPALVADANEKLAEEPEGEPKKEGSSEKASEHNDVKISLEETDSSAQYEGVSTEKENISGKEKAVGTGSEKETEIDSESGSEKETEKNSEKVAGKETELDSEMGVAKVDDDSTNKGPEDSVKGSANDSEE